MDTDPLLEIGARGVHLLFETDEIAAAFRRDADALRADLAGRHAEVQCAIDALTSIDDLPAGRRLITTLPSEIRDVLVLLYFDLIDTHLRRAATLH
jgi:hypothetical protein